ncbi:uncharacterized protein LOC110401471 isoform X2 [Numida meleagris]|uniref:uncharacterized protein LOC110401471 isoform X2 n=1 Tax=Numida meleagris TaxID=8996 RepID=UPI000B3D8FFB|nr:uncharacterized protein LOC110401471 isoform X2 [Numida meleagris]
MESREAFSSDEEAERLPGGSKVPWRRAGIHMVKTSWSPTCLQGQRLFQTSSLLCKRVIAHFFWLHCIWHLLLKDSTSLLLMTRINAVNNQDFTTLGTGREVTKPALLGIWSKLCPDLSTGRSHHDITAVLIWPFSLQHEWAACQLGIAAMQYCCCHVPQALGAVLQKSGFYSLYSVHNFA